jgi:phosphoribosyl 1,2-cyclic phosphodiesterase
MEERLKLRFWGVRGSIASPGPDTVRYGGNTTSLEIRTDDNHLILIDGGTGIHRAALSLLGSMPLKANIFITHTHWDHIQGLPFFVPIFVPGNSIMVHGPHDPVSGHGIEQAMEVQMQYSFFPIREAELKANMSYKSLMPGEPVTIEDATITPVLLNHPVINYGYRIDCNGKSFFFTGDHEPHVNIYSPEDEGYAAYQAIIDKQTADIDRALAGVDVLVADSSYTPEEYAKKVGWGHGTYDTSMQLAHRVGAKSLFCTHHEPNRSDDALETAFAAALERNGDAAKAVDIKLSKEGLVMEW